MISAFSHTVCVILSNNRNDHDVAWRKTWNMNLFITYELYTVIEMYFRLKGLHFTFTCYNVSFGNSKYMRIWALYLCVSLRIGEDSTFDKGPLKAVVFKCPRISHLSILIWTAYHALEQKVHLRVLIKPILIAIYELFGLGIGNVITKGHFSIDV